ncbi:glycosyltransferase family 2 protein [Candidatus Pacearchaeota archaeon]|nr:glycosyltransferase family 2 protein [Candidatus Pacearchaeota archaeon]
MSHISISEISVIIPTYNRANDLKTTLEYILPFSKKLCQIIIVDQSTNKDTKKVVDILSRKSKNIRYIFSKIPSITIARNKGIEKLSDKSRLACFIDDDVSIDENYFNEILNVFNANPDAKAVAGYVPSPELRSMPFMERLLRKIFFISYGEKNRARIISTYGNTYPSSLSKTIKAQWLPGVNMVYKTEVFREQLFDDKLLGYTVAEDIDFSYRLYKKYPGSLFITPYAKLVHRVSKTERAPTPKISYINQVDHFYFQAKNMNSLRQKSVFIWSLFGIILLRAAKMALTRKKEDLLKFRYFVLSLKYCIREHDKIRRGFVRDFLKEQI